MGNERRAPVGRWTLGVVAEVISPLPSGVGLTLSQRALTTSVTTTGIEKVRVSPWVCTGVLSQTCLGRTSPREGEPPVFCPGSKDTGITPVQGLTIDEEPSVTVCSTPRVVRVSFTGRSPTTSRV